jgi:hypothetical protein
MAIVVTQRDVSATTTNGTSYASGSFTPAAGEILVIAVAATGTALAAPTMTSSAGLTINRYTTFQIGADQISLFIATAGASATPQTVTFDCTGDTATGCIINVWGVTGIDGGTSSFNQSATDSGSATVTPAPTFASSVDTNNAVVGALFNGRNPAAVTEPSGFTEDADTGYGTPAAGGEFVHINSGFTGTTVTWGSAGGSFGGWGVLVAELIASSSGRTATLSKTLDDTTISSTAKVELKATLSNTLSDTTVAATAVKGRTATVSKTLSDTTVAATATVAIKSTLAKTLSDTTVASTAQLAIKSTLAKTLSDTTIASTAAVAIKGTLAKTLSDTTVAATAQLPILAATSATLEDTTLVATTSKEIYASLDVTLADVTLSASATLPYAGPVTANVDITLADVTLNASAGAVVTDHSAFFAFF